MGHLWTRNDPLYICGGAKLVAPISKLLLAPLLIHAFTLDAFMVQQASEARGAAGAYLSATQSEGGRHMGAVHC